MVFDRVLGNYKLVDLTATLDEKLPGSWPTHIPFQKKVWNWYKEYFTEWLILDEHTGTHFDAPSHFIPKPETGLPYASAIGNTTGEYVNIGQLMGVTAVIDVTELNGIGKNGESPYIDAQHILAWEEENGAIQPDSIVLFYSGWDKYYVAGEEGNKYAYNPIVKKEGPGWPAPNVAAVELLIERGVKCVGTDGASMGSVQDGLPVHVTGLSKGLLYVEALTNLDKLNVKGDYFIFLPLKVAGSSGGPGRAIAFVK